jgi:hypothetical protein
MPGETGQMSSSTTVRAARGESGGHGDFRQAVESPAIVRKRVRVCLAVSSVRIQPVALKVSKMTKSANPLTSITRGSALHTLIRGPKM